jgi:hypothetical protein
MRDTFPSSKLGQGHAAGQNHDVAREHRREPRLCGSGATSGYRNKVSDGVGVNEGREAGR